LDQLIVVPPFKIGNSNKKSGLLFWINSRGQIGSNIVPDGAHEYLATLAIILLIAIQTQ
jgi:hypothetical protein